MPNLSFEDLVDLLVAESNKPRKLILRSKDPAVVDYEARATLTIQRETEVWLVQLEDDRFERFQCTTDRHTLWSKRNGYFFTLKDGRRVCDP